MSNKMRRQRNRFPTKEQNKTPGEKTNEMEMINLHDKMFSETVIKMYIKLEIRMENSETAS